MCHRQPAVLLIYVVASSLLVACGLLGDGDTEAEEPPPTAAFLEAEADGIAIRIVEAEYALTGTRLQVEIERPEGAFARIGYYYRPPFDPDIHLQGFAEIDRLGIATSGAAEADFDRIEYQLGEVLDADESVVFEIQKLCPVEQPNPRCQEGPWRFEWVPGTEAVDSVDTTIPVNETHSDGGLVIHLDEVRISSSEVVVTTWSESETGTERPFPILMMRLADGTEVRGEGGGGSSDEPPRTLKTWRFPTLPDGVEEFWIGVEPYLREAPLSGSFTFSLPDGLGGLDPDALEFNKVAIGEEIEVGGERLRLSHVQVGHGHLNFVIENTTDGERSLHFGHDRPATLTDSSGRTYMPTGGGGNLTGETSFRYQGIDLSAVDRMELGTTSMGVRVEGPAPFHVVCPDTCAKH